MGYDATNYLSSSVSKKKVIDFIKMVGFTGRGDVYYFFKDEDYKYLYGVWLDMRVNNDELLVHTRTPIYCSPHDLQFQNYVIKQIRHYFGGYFITDCGTNRYFEIEGIDTDPAERGCYAAHFRLSDLFSELSFLIHNYKENDNQAKALENFGIPSSTALLSNISTTYISSIVENYFRQLYVALLKYSSKKENIIVASKINHFDLVEVSDNQLSVEDAVALSKSFQNIHKINAYFRELDNRIDIKGTLSKPYHRRKETIFDTLDRVLEKRHALVHRMNVDIKYKVDEVDRDLKTIEHALDKVYEHICQIYGWESL